MRQQEADKAAEEEENTYQDRQIGTKSQIESIEYVADSIVGNLADKPRTLYWVRWHGCKGQKNTWELTENLKKHLFARYERRNLLEGCRLWCIWAFFEKEDCQDHMHV